MAARIKDQPGVGIVIGVIDGGKTSIYKAGSSGTKRPLDEHTLFEIGSVTKTFTATILASMVADGTVALDDPIEKYMPRNVHVPERNGKKITLLNLATQRSGLPRLPTNMDALAPDPYAHYSLTQLYGFLNTYSLPRDPGAEYEYSNLGIGLLGEVLALREKTSYSNLLRSRVLVPLGMNETSLSLTSAIRSRVAVGHDADGDPTGAWTFDAIAPAGGIRSSVNDMLKYLRCNMGVGPLEKACLFAQQPRVTNDDGSRIGLTWFTGKTRSVVFHEGGTGGFRSVLAISPDHTKAVVILTNGLSENIDMAIHLMDSSYPLRPSPVVADLDAATLAEYEGTYTATQPPLAFTITRRGNRVSARVTGQEALRIYPSKKDAFYYRAVAAQIDFLRDRNGKVNALTLHQNGNNVTAVRDGMAPAGVVQPTYPPIIALDEAILDSYVGSYEAKDGLGFAVTHTADKLLVQLTGQTPFQVYASAKDRFYYKVVDAQIDFQRDASGAVASLVLHQNGRDYVAAKK